jgi:hypothetical protein
MPPEGLWGWFTPRRRRFAPIARVCGAGFRNPPTRVARRGRRRRGSGQGFRSGSRRVTSGVAPLGLGEEGGTCVGYRHGGPTGLGSGRFSGVAERPNEGSRGASAHGLLGFSIRVAERRTAPFHAHSPDPPPESPKEGPRRMRSTRKSEAISRWNPSLPWRTCRAGSLRWTGGQVRLRPSLRDGRRGESRAPGVEPPGNLRTVAPRPGGELRSRWEKDGGGR